jgi:hypothetical protein
MFCRVGNSHIDGVIANRVREIEAIRIRTAIGIDAKIHDQCLGKLIREARVPERGACQRVAAATGDLTKYCSNFRIVLAGIGWLLRAGKNTQEHHANKPGSRAASIHMYLTLVMTFSTIHKSHFILPSFNHFLEEKSVQKKKRVSPPQAHCEGTPLRILRVSAPLRDASPFLWTRRG